MTPLLSVFTLDLIFHSFADHLCGVHSVPDPHSGLCSSWTWLFSGFCFIFAGSCALEFPGGMAYVQS
jgi:hypothetical protein